MIDFHHVCWTFVAWGRHVEGQGVLCTTLDHLLFSLG